MSSKTTNLDAAAQERKARLAKLRSLKRKQSEIEDESPASGKGPEKSSEDVVLNNISGRNYDIETRGPKLGFEHAPTEGQVTLEEQAMEISKVVSEKAKEEEAEDQPIDLFKLQPKKPTEDLKRRLEEKMKLLRPRTQNAIAKMVRQRIEASQKAAKEQTRRESTSPNAQDNVGMEGITLVESIRIKEEEANMDDDEVI